MGNITGEPCTITLEGNWKDCQTGKNGSEFAVANNRLQFLIQEQI